MALPKIPSIVKKALLYKAQLNSHLEKVTNDMADQWVKISAGLSKNIDDLIAEMQIRNVMDMPLAERARWMAEMDRYQDLLAQSEAMAKSYGAWSADYITNAQIQSIRLGVNEFSSVTQGYFVGMPSPQIEMLHGALTGKSPLLRLFNQIGSKDAMENALLMGLSMGKPLSEIGKDLAAAANISLVRGTLIARTEVIRAHNTTSLDLYQRYGIEKYRRMASRGHACMACLMLDGEILNSRDALYDHPNGACTTVPIVDPDNPPNWETGKEYFEKLPEAEQRQRMGTNFYDAWKRGDFTLQDLVSIRHDPIWGDSPQITPLKTLSPNWKSYRQISGIPQGSQGAYVSGRVFTEADWDTLRKRIADNKEWFAEGHMDYTLKEMYRMTGYDGLPTMLSQSEYDKMVASGQITDLYRTVRGQGGVSGQVYVQDFRTGDYFAGKGLYGNGTYFTPSKSYAESYGGDLIQAGLRSDAKVISYSDLQELMKQNSGLDTYRQALFERGWSEKDVSLLDAFQRMDRINAQEIGKFAVSMGYDAIDLGTIPHGLPEVIVLNRTAMFIKR